MGVPIRSADVARLGPPAAGQGLDRLAPGDPVRRQPVWPELRTRAARVISPDPSDPWGSLAFCPVRMDGGDVTVGDSTLVVRRRLPRTCGGASGQATRAGRRSRIPCVLMRKRGGSGVRIEFDAVPRVALDHW
jgi:hypothetical protein